MKKKKSIPKIEFPAQLPISQKKDSIMAAIAANQVVVLAGETGSGKTTQIPKMCLALGRGLDKRIGHTQPRRLAAKSVASRIAQELNTNLGDLVGYKVRFQDKVSPNCAIKLLTDGMLLNQTKSDRLLKEYDTLILDEAHERSVNIDFLLGFLKKILPKRPDLKLIITSATIEVERFSQFFDDAPIIEVSGRSFPVEIRYQDYPELDVIDKIADCVDLAVQEGPGDILIFQSGEGEIREAQRVLNGREHLDCHVLPLFARMSLRDQQAIFKPAAKRKIILATNIAETSLTIPNIRFVIDPGTHKISRYSHRLKMQRLPIEKISKANARQRSGRCGRVGSGICFRLYPQEDFELRPDFMEPELLRMNLAGCLLQLMFLKMGDVREFPFLTPPENKYINDGLQTLTQLGAIEEQRLTSVGVQLAKMPLEPKIAKMLLAGDQYQCLKEVLVIASALSVQDPKERPKEKSAQADEAHQKFADKSSDFIALLKLWDAFNTIWSESTHRQFAKWAKQHYLSVIRLREWLDVHQQLKDICKELGFRLNQEKGDYPEIHKSLLSGLVNQLGTLSPEKNYVGTRNIRFQIFPGSCVFKKRPAWLMTSEFLELNQIYAMQVAKVEPEWIEETHAHLLRTQYLEPYFDAKRGIVMAKAQISLLGLDLVKARSVVFGKINSVRSREVLIRQGLVEGLMTSKADFYQNYLSLLSDIHSQERKMRLDLVHDDDNLYAIWDVKIPSHIYDQASLENFAKNNALTFLESDLCRTDSHLANLTQFPGEMTLKGIELKLEYHFEPDQSHDGVWVLIPQSLLERFSENEFSYLVPGLLLERIESLLRTLPKGLRKQISPIPDFARKCLEDINPQGGDLLLDLSRQVQRQTAQTFLRKMWDESTIPPYLRMTYALVDNENRIVLKTKAFDELKPLKTTIQIPIEENLKAQSWEFGTVLLEHQEQIQAKAVTVYPALVDKSDHVELGQFASKELADSNHQRGVLRLLVLCSKKVKNFRQSTPHKAVFKRLEKRFPKQSSIMNQIAFTSLQSVWANKLIDVRDEASFKGAMEDSKDFNQVVNELANCMALVLKGLEAMDKRLLNPRFKNAQFSSLLRSVELHLDSLFDDAFIESRSPKWLYRYPFYLKAILVRLDKATTDMVKDNQFQKSIEPYLKALAQLNEQDDGAKQAPIENFRVAIEEYRLSHYAQELKTAFPISPKRLKQYYLQCIE